MEPPYSPRDVAAFLLVGGRSTRMGRDKARLPYRGSTLVRILHERLRPLTASVTLVAKVEQEYADLDVPVCCDARPGHALVHGIETALRQPGPPWRLLLACDMPGVDARVVHGLWVAAQAGGRGSYPQPGNQHDPLPSLWHHTVGSDVDASWGLRAQDWLQHAGLTPWRVPEEDRSRLANVNTPEQWRIWLQQEGKASS